MKRGVRIAIATAVGVLPAPVVALAIFAPPEISAIFFLTLSLGGFGILLGVSTYRALGDD